MARTVEITSPPDRTEQLVKDVEALDGVLGIRVDRGTSRRPAGDVTTVLVTNVGLHPLLRLLDRHGIASDPGASITLSEPAGVISQAAAEKISTDSTEIPWEEMEYTIARESNTWPNTLVMMAAAGVFAAIGIATSALHLVLAAMLIAPGFEPIVRVGLGLVSRSPVWQRGLADFAAGYAALLAGAIAASVVLLLFGRSLPAAEASYLELGELPKYWTTITAPGVVVSVVGGFAGAVLVANNRSVLTAGVMVALSLVPTVTMAGMGLVAENVALITRGLAFWLLDVALVLVTSVLVFTWKLHTVQHRTMLG